MYWTVGRIAFIFLLALSIFSTLAEASDVCRLPSFEGMEQNKKRALSVLADTTTQDVAKTQVYIEYDGDVIYYHSNFVSRGVDEDGKPFRHPTKVKGTPSKNPAFGNVRQVFKNLIYTSPPDATEAVALDQALRSSVLVHVDVSVFDERGLPRIDLSGISNIRIVDGKKGQSLGLQPELLTTSRPPPSIIAKIKGCCLFGRPPHLISRLSDSLSKQIIDTSKVKFASLFIDSATEGSIAQSSKVKGARLTGDSKSIRTRADFDGMMARAKGATLLLIGHVEGADYVIRDSANRESFRISIDDARSVARANGTRLIDIGCETIRAIDATSFGLGVMTKYNSVDAVNSLQRALANSKTYEDFLVNITSDGLKVVVEKSFVDQAESRQASVYARIKDKARLAWTKVATVTFSGFGS